MDLIYQMVIYAPTFVSLLWAVILLLEPKSKNLAKHFLGYFMLVASLVYFSHVVYFTKHYNLYLFVDPIYNFASLAVYPMFYWYVKLLTTESYFDFKNFKHLIPALVVFLISGLIYLFMNDSGLFIRVVQFRDEVFIGAYPNLWNVQKYVLVLSRIIFFIQVMAYLYFGMIRIEEYQKLASNFYSNLEGRDMKWIKWLILIFSLTAIVSTASNFVGRYYFLKETLILVIPALAFSILLFIIGYLGIKQTYTINEFVTDEGESDYYVESYTFGTLKKQLINLFEKEKIYIRNDLRINQVGKMLNSNRTYISKLINEEFNCSFTDFVNNYRIEEAKNLLKSEQSNLYTLEFIAESAGFTSAGSLIRIFKQFEATTPGNYRKKFGNGG